MWAIRRGRARASGAAGGGPRGASGRKFTASLAGVSASADILEQPQLREEVGVMEVDFASLVVGAALTLIGSYTSHRLGFSSDEWRRKRRFRTLLVLLERDLVIAEQIAGPPGSIFPAGLPALDQLLSEGLLDLLDDAARDHSFNARTSLFYTAWFDGFARHMVDGITAPEKLEAWSILKGDLEEQRALAVREIRLALPAVRVQMRRMGVRFVHPRTEA